MERLIFGTDFDNTITASQDNRKRQFLQQAGLKTPSSNINIDSLLRLNPNEKAVREYYDECIRELYISRMDETEPRSGVAAAFRRLRNCNYQIHILTSRHPGEELDAAQQWLKKMQIPYDALKSVSSDRKHEELERVSAQAYVDDNSQTLCRIASNLPRVCLYLMGRGKAPAYRVKQWNDVLTHMIG